MNPGPNESNNEDSTENSTLLVPTTYFEEPIQARKRRNSCLSGHELLPQPTKMLLIQKRCSPRYMHPTEDDTLPEAPEPGDTAYQQLSPAEKLYQKFKHNGFDLPKDWEMLYSLEEADRKLRLLIQRQNRAPARPNTPADGTDNIRSRSYSV